jgi:hypothetical protein
MEEYENEN